MSKSNVQNRSKTAKSDLTGPCACGLLEGRGLSNRLFPQEGKKALLVAMAHKPDGVHSIGAQVIRQYASAVGMELSEDEATAQEMWETFLADLAPLVFEQLNGLGFEIGGNPARALPTPDRWSYKVADDALRDIRTPAGLGSITGPMTAPSSREEVEARMRAARERLAAAKLPPSAPPADAPKADGANGDGKPEGKKARGGKS